MIYMYFRDNGTTYCVSMFSSKFRGEKLIFEQLYTLIFNLVVDYNIFILSLQIDNII